MKNSSLKNANVSPWNCSGNGLDVNAQASFYSEAMTALASKSWFQGTFWWLWSTDPTAGGLNDTSYTPQGKPAVTVLNTFYKKL